MKKIKDCLESVGNNQYKVIKSFKLGLVTLNPGIVITKGVKLSGIDPTNHLDDLVE